MEASAPAISLADHRARRLVERLVSIQDRIDSSARLLLSGQRCADPIEVLLDEMDHTLADLARNAPHVRRAQLRIAIRMTCRAHARWSRARLGSEEERAAASAYLETVDLLARVATYR